MANISTGLKGAAFAAVIGSFVAVAPANATVFTPASVTSSSDFNGAYAASNAIDATPNTDWVSGTNGSGALIFNFAAPVSFGQITVTDRLTSGGGQGTAAYGTGDVTTSYTIQAFTDGSYTTAMGPAVTGTLAVPASPTGPAAFMSTVNLQGITSAFLKYTIVTGNGPNLGVDNITFTDVGVPEPTSMLLLVSGVGLAWSARRSRKDA